MRVPVHRLGLLGVLGLYLLLGAAYAARTPDWQNPDEPAHVQVVTQLADNGCCPVIQPGDWNQALLSDLTGSQFAPDRLSALPTIQYEDHQPPLFYLAALPLFEAANYALLSIRLLSLLLGAGVVVAAYAAARMLFPSQGWLAVSAAAFTAFVPQHLAMLAAANNDALAELIVAVGLLLAIAYLRGTGERGLAWAFVAGTVALVAVLVFGALPAGGVAPVAIGAAALACGVAAAVLWRWHGDTPPALIGLAFGAVAGIAFLTKMNAAFIAGVIALAILLRWSFTPGVSGRQRVAGFVRDGLLAAIVALALGGIWWARNVSVYGFPDLFGLRAHDAVVVGQLRTADFFAQIGLAEGVRHFLLTTYQSWWGQLGWMALPLPNWANSLVTTFLMIVVGGWLVRALRRDQPTLDAPARWRKLSAVVLAAAALFVIAQYFYYNSVFYQAQGRYLFPALLPVAIAIALGLAGWSRLAPGERSVVALRWAGPAFILLVLVPLNVYVVGWIVPLLAPA